MKNYLMIAGIAAATVASPAMAQEEQAAFTGAKIEAIAGYDDLEGSDGVAYGIAAGYDFQVGGVVIGAEAELTDSSISETEEDVIALGDSLKLGLGRDIYVGARLGAAVSPSTLLYVKAGYTNARVELEYDDGVTTLEDHGNGDGYRLGAGLEQKFRLFGPSGFAKLEYRYSNYKNIDGGGVSADIDADRHQVLAGFGFRF